MATRRVKAKKPSSSKTAEYVCDWGTEHHFETRAYVGPAGAKGRAHDVLDDDATRASKFSQENYDAIREMQMKIRGSDITEEVRTFEVTIDSHYEMVRVIRLYRRQKKEKKE